MRTDQWKALTGLVSGEKVDLHAALIVDSPWIPPFFGISTEDYINKPEVHFKANMDIMARFPEVIFFPGFWAEMGMAAEPSGFGAPLTYYPNQPPSVHHIIDDIEQADSLKQPNPLKDGLMPRILRQYEGLLPLVREKGMDIKIVAARGPMTLASHLMGVTNFLVGLKTEPEKTHKLMKMMTQVVMDWLDAQASILPGVDGIFVLDDIMGFLGEEDYLEFAHGYFKQIFSGNTTLKVLHNDTPNPISFKYLSDLGVNMFNFSHMVPIPDLRKMAGDSVVLMGNISPLDIMVNGSYDEVHAAALGCIEQNAGHSKFLLSAGGGVSMGTPESTLRAIIAAVAQSNAAAAALGKTAAAAQGKSAAGGRKS
jgi:uroporphyrinogen decarboxylase